VLVRRTIRTLVVIAAVVSATGIGSAASGAGLTPRVQTSSPWTKDDQVGEAFRPQGDVRRIVVANGRQNMTFTFRMVQTPVWDTVQTSRATHMAFKLDWQGTSAAPNRRITVSKSDGGWHGVVFNGTGGAVCTFDGGVQGLPNHGYRFSVPVQMCLGGAHVTRVAAEFRDDQEADASEDIKRDFVPNSGSYGPFIRLPN
jgi:hypothetical protein